MAGSSASGIQTMLSIPDLQQFWGKGLGEMMVVCPWFCSQLQQVHV